MVFCLDRFLLFSSSFKILVLVIRILFLPWQYVMAVVVNSAIFIAVLRIVALAIYVIRIVITLAIKYGGGDVSDTICFVIGFGFVSSYNTQECFLR